MNINTKTSNQNPFSALYRQAHSTYSLWAGSQELVPHCSHWSSPTFLPPVTLTQRLLNVHMQALCKASLAPCDHLWAVHISPSSSHGFAHTTALWLLVSSPLSLFTISASVLFEWGCGSLTAPFSRMDLFHFHCFLIYFWPSLSSRFTGGVESTFHAVGITVKSRFAIFSAWETCRHICFRQKYLAVIHSISFVFTGWLP